MCIAILNNSDTLTRETLNNSWNNNPEGAGLLWASAGRVHTFKTYKRKELIKRYYKLRAEINTPIVLHFRIATSGHERYTNLHPFEVNAALGFVHNGILTGLGDKTHSDTYQFNEKLKTLPADFIECETMRELIGKYITTSKLIFLTGDNRAHIINEHLGTWDGSNWFSNDSHKYDLDFYYFGNEKRSKETKPAGKVKATPTNKDIERQQVIDSARIYFTGVTEHAINRLEYLLDTDAETSAFLWEVEDAARLYSCYDLEDLCNMLERPSTTGRIARSYYTNSDFYSEHFYN